MPVRRTPAPAPPPPPASGANFGDLDFYGGNFLLPEGDYALEFNVVVHANTKADGTPGVSRLGVMVTAYPIDEGGALIGDVQEQFMSMGSKAHTAWAPNPDTGKGIVAIPGAPAISLAGMSNWGLFLKSLYDCGLPKGIFTNDVSTIDGIWVHTKNVPEPEERKSFASSTGEVQPQQRTGPQMIPVVTEIKEDGKPWENGGGIPDEQAAAPAPPVAAAPARRPGPRAVPTPPAAPARAAAKPLKAAPPAATNGGGDPDVMAAAIQGVSSVLEANPAGCTRLLLRTGAFKAIKATEGDDMAQAVLDSFFTDDTVLNTVLGQVGFQAVNAQVVPA